MSASSRSDKLPSSCSSGSFDCIQSVLPVMSGDSCYKDNKARRIVIGLLRNASMRSPRAASWLPISEPAGFIFRRLKLMHSKSTYRHRLVGLFWRFSKFFRKKSKYFERFGDWSVYCTIILFGFFISLSFVKSVVSKETAPFLCAGSANLRIGSSLGCWKVPAGVCRSLLGCASISGLDCGVVVDYSLML